MKQSSQVLRIILQVSSEWNGSVPGHQNTDFGINAKRTHAVAYSEAGLRTANTKRQYDEEHLFAGLMANNAEA